MPFYQAVPATLEARPLTTHEGFYATRPRQQRADLLQPHSHPDTVSFRIGCSSFSARPSHQRSETPTHRTTTGARIRGPLCRRLTDDAEGQLGTITTPKQARDDPNQYDTHQLNLVRSHTDTTAGIRTTPPHLSLPPAVDGNKPASYVNRDTRPPAARRRNHLATPNLGRDALVAKSVHPAPNPARISQRQLLPPPQQWLFRSPAEASHFMRDAPRTAPASCR